VLNVPDKEQLTQQELDEIMKEAYDVDLHQ
jgi:hypothetical protein